MLKHCIFAVCAACTALLTGCGDNTTVVAGAGTLVVDWTVSGTKDPAECDASGAQDADVTVSSGNVVIGEFASDCRNFSEAISLGPGTYDAQAVLLDSAGADRTTSIAIGPVQIFGGDQVVVPINFPASSFF
jgi:hypothetical protein